VGDPGPGYGVRVTGARGSRAAHQLIIINGCGSTIDRAIIFPSDVGSATVVVGPRHQLNCIDE
jgi:hypothetical protein